MIWRKFLNEGPNQRKFLIRVPNSAEKSLFSASAIFSEDQSGALEVFGMKIAVRVALDNIY